ncbi:OLC1v1024369C1 [Oldenlandia corymbosa var. corymbosa]|uniref:OLC1v1024369C1 n=1 Tax=Oldenlandia corymbosa var. corymbosa TaxID=529605 RepID=A0AAV1C3W9_OLDCO|nr:OLC1v1024369C1 [Oldenlandia corymbosa var. corymbosa]
MNFGEFDESNTLLVDDSVEKSVRNLAGNVIHPITFTYIDKEFDKRLAIHGDLCSYLNQLAKAEDVVTFVRENPFVEEPQWQSAAVGSFAKGVLYDAVLDSDFGGEGPLRARKMCIMNFLTASWKVRMPALASKSCKMDRNKNIKKTTVKAFSIGCNEVVVLPRTASPQMDFPFEGYTSRIVSCTDEIGGASELDVEERSSSEPATSLVPVTRKPSISNYHLYP